MKELLGIILLTLLVVLGSCNSNTNVSLMETSPQLFGVRQVAQVILTIRIESCS